MSHSIRVPVVRLDSLPLPSPDLIKLDVEGSETAVLRGARQLLERAGPAIVIELHATNEEVSDLLDDCGYTTQNLDSSAPVRSAGPVHILARPREHR